MRVLVEQILEPYLNYYVVNTWDEAARAVRLLSQAQKGRANFFIREEFRDVRTTTPVAGVTAMLDQLQIEPGYEGLVTTLLQHVYVADQSPADGQWTDPALRNATVIDRQGQMIRRAGQLAGGSVGLFEGKKLGRKKHLEHLDEEIASLRQAFQQMQAGVKDMQGRLTALQAVDRAQALRDLRSRVVRLSQACTELASRLQHLQTRADEYRQKQDSNIRQVAAFDERIAGANAQLAVKRDELRQHTQTLEISEEKYTDVQRQLQAAEKAFNDAQLQDLQLRNKLDSNARELTYVSEQIAQIGKTHDLQQQQLTSGSAELEQVKAKQIEYQDTLLQLYELKKAQEARLTEAEQHYYQQRNEISAVDDQIRHAEKQKNNQQFIINELKDHNHQLKFRLMAISERLQVEFGVRLEDVPDSDLDETLPLEELEAKVHRQKNRLDNYGEINPMAIDAHREIKERFDNITQQREDILKAKETLLTTITEIESTATTQFLEAFNNVRENFIEVFRSLFTEDDTCDLVLIDPANPLESDIDIIAKPKGKRPKSLSQLSGGEKTLTAIALLFALYLLKPAPFCIFDEVDAPLDDANIQKFNRIIKKFSSQSQFIIVTHNKTTMSAVDTIYGVYMEEMGISGLSQVDFRAFDERDLLAVQN
jgi:chromosome segregation protein